MADQGLLSTFDPYTQTATSLWQTIDQFLKANPTAISESVGPGPAGPMFGMARMRPPATYHGFQETPGYQRSFRVPGVEGFELYNLTADIPGHPTGSTVSGKTLTDLGYDLPRSKGAAAYQSLSDSVRRLIESRTKAGTYGQAPDVPPQQLSDAELAQFRHEMNLQGMREAERNPVAAFREPLLPPTLYDIKMRILGRQAEDVSKQGHQAAVYGLGSNPDLSAIVPQLEEKLRLFPSARSKVFGQLYDLPGMEAGKSIDYTVPITPSAVVATPKSLLEEFKARQIARHALPKGMTLKPPTRK